MAYPLNSKRLKLRQIQHLASALDLPTSASRDDLEVTQENSHIKAAPIKR